MFIFQIISGSVLTTLYSQEESCPHNLHVKKHLIPSRETEVYQEIQAATLDYLHKFDEFPKSFDMPEILFFLDMRKL